MKIFDDYVICDSCNDEVEYAHMLELHKQKLKICRSCMLGIAYELNDAIRNVEIKNSPHTEA